MLPYNGGVRHAHQLPLKFGSELPPPVMLDDVCDFLYSNVRWDLCIAC